MNLVVSLFTMLVWAISPVLTLASDGVPKQSWRCKAANKATFSAIKSFEVELWGAYDDESVTFTPLAARKGPVSIATDDDYQFVLLGRPLMQAKGIYELRARSEFFSGDWLDYKLVLVDEMEPTTRSGRGDAFIITVSSSIHPNDLFDCKVERNYIAKSPKKQSKSSD
jgi:hypothetical protein